MTDTSTAPSSESEVRSLEGARGSTSGINLVIATAFLGSFLALHNATDIARLIYVPARSAATTTEVLRAASDTSPEADFAGFPKLGADRAFEELDAFVRLASTDPRPLVESSSPGLDELLEQALAASAEMEALDPDVWASRIVDEESDA